jgi:homocysteine S-methyltransferase
VRTFLELLAESPILFDGGIGTDLYGRDVFLNLCYEELNLERPELVEEVHRAFLVAGADAVETNTFSANRPRLEPHGLGERVREINRAGAGIARRAVEHQALVAGAIGPLGIRLEPWGPTTVDEAVALFREQVEGLVEGGVDLLCLETFSDLVEIQAAVDAVRQACDLPVIAMMTVDEQGRTPEGVAPEWLGQKLEATGADVIGVNCSVGPAPMLSIVETMAAICSRPLAAMPNAGIPRNIDGRMHYLTSPAYMARYVRRFIDAGARVVGGCCGVSPEHIRAMRELIGHGSGEERILPKVVVRAPGAVPRQPVPAERRSRLARKVKARRFLTMSEVSPPRGCDTDALLAEVGTLANAGVDAVVIPDDPRALVRMSPMALAWLVLERTGGRSPAWDTLEPILQYSCRDRTLLGMQSDLLGAHALGIRNLLPVTGRSPRPGEISWSTAVFDVDAIGLTNVISRLNHGLDVGDSPIGSSPTEFFALASATVGIPDLDAEINRFEWKVDAGAELAVTSPVFDVAELERFLARVEHVRIPVVANIWPVSSLREAEYLAGEVPGVNVPQDLLDRLGAAGEGDEQRRIGLSFASELLGRMRPLVEGVMLSGPLARSADARELIRPLIGTEVAVGREYPGRPGIMGSSEASRYG